MFDNHHLTRKNARYDIGSKPAMFSKKFIDKESGIKVHN